MNRGRLSVLPLAVLAWLVPAACAPWLCPTPGFASDRVLEFGFDPAAVRMTPGPDGVDVVIPGFEPAPDAAGRLLPFRAITVTLPDGVRVASIRTTILESRELDTPAPPRAATDPALASRAFAFTRDAPGATAGGAADPVITLASEGSLGGTTVATLIYRAVRYDAERARLVLASRVRVTLVLAPAAFDRHRVIPRRQSSAVVTLRRSLLQRLDGDEVSGEPGAGLLLGSPGYFQPGQFPSLDGSLVEYVIVTSDSLAPDFQRLADWKTRSGVPAAIRTVSWIEANYPGRDRAERIRNFLAAAYRDWGTLWVLLAGDEAIVPSRLAHTNTYGGENIAADLYYGDLDGTWDGDGDGVFGEGYASAAAPGDSVDLYPDVFVGRAPVETHGEAQTFIDKTLAYLQAPALGYQNDGLFVAEVVFPLGWEPGQPIDLNGCTLAHEAGAYVPASWDTTYLCEYPNGNESHAAVVSALSQGPALVSVVGHGDPFKWSTSDGYFFSIDDANSLSNAGKYFLIFYADCNTNQVESECVNEALLLNPNGGSIGSVGATRFDFPSVGRYYQNELYRLFYGEGIHEAGALASLMKVPRVGISRFDLSYDRWTQLTYIYLGDPELALWGAVPRSASLTRPSSIAVGDSLLTVTLRESPGSTPIPDALVTLWKPSGGEYARGMTGASGEVTFPIRPSGTGTMLVTATHPSFLPVVDSLQVVPGAADVAVSAVTVDDDSSGASLGNGDGVFDAGERVELAVTLANRSGSAADSVIAALSLPGSSQLRAALATGGSAGVLFYGARGARAATMPLVLGGTVDSLPAWGRPNYNAYAADDTSGVELRARGYLWQDASGWHLRGAGGGRVARFTGSVAVSGHLTSESAADLEPGDSWGVNGDSLFFAFQVDSSDFEDGVDFTVADSLGIGIIAAAVPYGAIPAGAQVTGSFVVDARPAGADSRALRFVVGLSGAGGASWQHGFRVDLAAARPAMEYAEVDDAPPGGDGDGVAEAGEAVAIRVHIRNRGTGRTRGLRATIRAVTGAAVTDSVSVIGDVPAGANAAALTPWRMTMTSGLATGQLVFGSSYGIEFTRPLALGGDSTPASPIAPQHETGATIADLRWNPVSAADLSGYNIYRAPLTGGSFTRVNSALTRSAYFRDEGLAARTAYRYRYAAVDSSGNQSALTAVDTVWTGPPYTPGFPVNAGSRMYASPVVADLAADGRFEVATATHGWKLDVFESNGTPRPGFPAALGQESFSSPAVGNLDTDIQREIVVGANNNRLYAFNADGTGLLSPSGIFGATGNWIQGSPTLADLDRDGSLEIIVPSKDDWLYVWRKDGTGYLQPDGKFGNFVAPSISCPAVADVDGDGLPEIFVTTTGSAIYAWNHDGTGFRLTSGQFKYIGGGAIWGSPVLGDIDGDGQKEVATASTNGSVYVYNMSAGLKSGWPKATGNSIHASPSLGDLDRDGKLEVVVGGDDHGLHAWRYNGVYLGGFPVTLPDSVLGSPVIGDVSGDGYPDIVCGCANNRVYAIQRNGQAVHGWPQRTYDEIWMSAPALADLDHDGDVDVIQGSYDGYLYAWDTGVSYNPATMDWPMYQHDRTHSGYFGWTDPDGATAVGGGAPGGAAETPRVSGLRELAPNPAPGAVTIAFDLATAGSVRLSVYDAAGRLIERPVDGWRAAGHYRVAWSGALRPGRAASGVYFIRMEAAGESWSKKLVLLH